MFNLTTFHGINRSFVTVDSKNSKGRIVDFNRPSLPYSMQFTAVAIDLQIEDDGGQLYAMPFIDEELSSTLNEHMFKTQVCQYCTSGMGIVIRSRDKHGKIRCQITGKLEADEKPWIVNGEVNL